MLNTTCYLLLDLIQLLLLWVDIFTPDCVRNQFLEVLILMTTCDTFEKRIPFGPGSCLLNLFLLEAFEHAAVLSFDCHHLLEKIAARLFLTVSIFALSAFIYIQRSKTHFLCPDSILYAFFSGFEIFSFQVEEFQLFPYTLLSRHCVNFCP